MNLQYELSSSKTNQRNWTVSELHPHPLPSASPTTRTAENARVHNYIIRKHDAV